MPMKDRRILVVEDEFLVAAMLCDFLEDEGAVAIGPVGRVSEALDAVAQGGFDLAVLDWNIDGQSSLPVAQALRSSGLPFLIATGYGQVEGDFADRPLLAKPYAREAVIATICELLDR